MIDDLPYSENLTERRESTESSRETVQTLHAQLLDEDSG